MAIAANKRDLPGGLVELHRAGTNAVLALRIEQLHRIVRLRAGLKRIKHAVHAFFLKILLELAHLDVVHRALLRARPLRMLEVRLRGGQRQFA